MRLCMSQREPHDLASVGLDYGGSVCITLRFHCEHQMLDIGTACLLFRENL